MTHKLIKTENYLLVLGDNYKSEEFSYIVAEKLTTGEYHLWQVDNPNDWDEPNQFEILSHLPLYNAPILEGVPLLPPIEDDVEKIADMKKEAFINGYNKAKEEFMSELDKQILDFEHDYNRTSSQHKHFGGALFALNRLKFYLSQSPIETYGE